MDRGKKLAFWGRDQYIERLHREKTGMLKQAFFIYNRVTLKLVHKISLAVNAVNTTASDYKLGGLSPTPTHDLSFHRRNDCTSTAVLTAFLAC